MNYTNPMKLRVSFLIVTLLGLIIYGCDAQSPSFSNDEITEVLDEIDTLLEDRIYHILIKSEDNETFQLHIWINDRLGETMFNEAGMNICRFFPYNESQVLVYEFKNCIIDVPPNFIRKTSSDSYAYLTESPFYVENGFYQAFLVKRIKSGLQRTKLELANENAIDKDFKEFMDF